ncbi:hypothetical protein VN97_g10024, partial [Penicillium thymicola]
SFRVQAGSAPCSAWCRTRVLVGVAGSPVKYVSRPYTKQTQEEKTKTYNSEDSLVVTHPTTNSPACGLSTAERTGSPIFHTLWSYVLN